MPETIYSFLDKVKQAALVLGDPATLDLIAAVREQVGAAKLRILIVGSTGSGRYSVANVILGQPDLLPTSPIPKAPVSLSVGYGDSVGVEVVANDGRRAAMPAEKLRPFMTSPATADSYQSIEVKTQCSLLKTSELRIESIDARRSAAEWKELLAGTDYIILILQAAALLSEQERRFVRDVLNANVGLERVAIVINQIDLIPEEERASLAELVRTFLGPFESQPLLAEFSATKARKGLEIGRVPPESGYEALMDLVRCDLIERHSTHKSAGMRQAAEICLAQLSDEATRQRALLTASEAELTEMLGKCDLHNQWLQGRVKRSQQRIEVFINTLIKEQFLREIEGFGNALRQQIPGEVLPVEDITEIKRSLPGYIESLWSEFFDRQLADVRNQLIGEMKLIGTTIEDDLKELLGENAPNFQNLLVGFDPTPSTMSTLLFPHRGENQSGAIATGFQVGGLFLLFANIPLGLASIGIGQVIRRVYKKEMAASDKRAIVTAAIDSTYELERQIKQQVEGRFGELADKLKQSIADLYGQELARMRVVLEDSIRHHKEQQARKEQITSLTSTTIPELQRLLAQLSEPAA